MWNHGAVTDIGRTVLAKAAGGKTLVIDGAQSGTGTVEEYELKTRTSLAGTTHVLGVINYEVKEDGVCFTVQIESTEDGYTAKQIGLFGHVDDEDSSLLAIYQDETGITIPDNEQMPDFLYLFYAQIQMNNSGSISITLDPSVLVSQRQLYVELNNRMPGFINRWLEANIMQETGYVIDNSLTVPGAAADAAAVGKVSAYTLDAIKDETIPFGIWDSGSGGGVSVVQAGELVTLNGKSTASSSQAYTKILICDHVQCWNQTTSPEAAQVYPIRTIAGHTYRATADIVGGTREKGDGSGIIRLVYIFDGSSSVYKNIGYTETHGELTFTSSGAGLRLQLGCARLSTMTNVVVRVTLRDVTAEKALVLDEITEEIEAESIAEITGDAGDAWTLRGITFAKISDHEFTLAGNSTAKVGKGFNVLLGSDELVINGATGMQTNISEPGVYTLAYKTSGADYNGALFAVTEGAFDKKRYVRSGESFVVEDEPVCLFSYASTSISLGTKTLTVKWALYKGEEYKGFPYTEDGVAVSAVDLVARNAGSDNGVNPMYQEYVSWGKANTLANARHIINIKWTPTGSTMVKGKDTYYEEGVEYQGIPYSSVRDSNKFVGIDVSLHTFMTAVNDPRSVLYTRRSNTQNSNCYYGSVCSTFCDYAYRLGMYLSNYYLGTCDLFEDVPLQDLQKGDLLYNPGHVMMCVDVTKDDYGRIATLTVWEEWAPNGRARFYRGLDNFIAKRPGYVARRYKYLSGVPYTPTPYVRCFDEDEADIVYPDVQTDHGDAAVFTEGDNVVIHVLDAKDYSSIVVTRGSTTVRTVTTIEDFTIENVSPGLYTITAVGTNNSVSTFYVVDMSCSLDAETHVLSFASTNATPTIVYVYGLETESGTGKIVPTGSPGTPLILTDADRAAGFIDLSDYIGETYPYAKIAFMTDYGTAMWYSETHQRWEPVT